MSNQVLTIDQCKELLALGLDMSDASCMWTSIVDSDYNPKDWLPVFRNDTTPIEVLREKFPMTYKDGNLYYTYSLQDILEKLPNVIVEKGMGYHLDIDFSRKSIEYYSYADEKYLYFYCFDNLLDGALELLKWCIENKYINKE